MNRPPSPAQGSFADGFEEVAATFADQLRSGEEVGAALSVYRRGEPVVDLWGGLADVARGRPWQRDTRIVVFSVSKGLAAMALHMIADRGILDWEAPVADYWPGFAKAGKAGITVEQLLCHRGGLSHLDRKLTMADCIDPQRAAILTEALEQQAPAWPPGSDQGYHALTYGLYAAELFARAAGETMGDFLRRELFEPLGSDARLGTPASEDHKMARLYGPSTPKRALHMVARSLGAPGSTEARILRAALRRDSLTRRAFENPDAGPLGVHVYNTIPVRRAELASASATASADGLARAYLPFASEGRHESRSYLRAESLAGAQQRLSWSKRDRVLLKPLGWSRGFLKEQRHLFSPNPESFGHAGMGGALGWCDPIEGLAFGYVMNRMDWRVRSARCLALCKSLYASPVLGRQRPRTDRPSEGAM
jgi:CubicO group peptidase (beta-lactamase class C family)